MIQQEFFPQSTFDGRCSNLFDYVKANWEINRTAIVYNLDFLTRCSKMYRVDCETVIKQWEKYLNELQSVSG